MDQEFKMQSVSLLSGQKGHLIILLLHINSYENTNARDTAKVHTHDMQWRFVR